MQERNLILGVIQNDKIERKHKEALRKALTEAEKRGNNGADRLIAQQLVSEMNHPMPERLPDCTLQVRLSDGSTI